MAYADQQMGGNKVVSIIIVALIHVLIGYLLISGLAISAVQQVVERVTTVDIEEPPPPEEPDEPPPPPDEPVSPPPPVAPPAPINLAPPPPFETQQEIPPEAPIALEIPPEAPVAAPVPPPPPPSLAQAATPRNQRRWQQRIIDDYPSRALRAEEEGTVRLSVTVTAEGRATNCRVTGSSGSSTLDRAACRSMERYSRFNPALNDAGNPTQGSYSTSITYVLN